jgi:hypothetical protein
MWTLLFGRSSAYNSSPWWLLLVGFIAAIYLLHIEAIFIANFGMSRTGTDQMHSGECLPVSGRENPYKAGYLLYLFFWPCLRQAYAGLNFCCTFLSPQFNNCRKSSYAVWTLNITVSSSQPKSKVAYIYRRHLQVHGEKIGTYTRWDAGSFDLHYNIEYT